MNQARGLGQCVFEDARTADAVAADLLRRAGELGRAAGVCRKALPGRCDDQVRQVLEFQIRLCETGDDAVHTMEEVLNR